MTTLGDPRLDEVAAAYGQAVRLLAAGLPGAWLEERDGVLGGVSGLPMPSLNGVWALGADPDADTAAGLLDRVVAAGVPHCLQLRPGAGEKLAATAAERGMTADEDVPLMVLARPPAARTAAGLAIRELTAAEADRHVDTAAAGFGAPREMFAAFGTREVFGLPGFRFYAGEADGEPVTTCLSVRVGRGLGIFSVATVPGQVRRGYGTAVTARAVRDGLDGGARWAFLHSSSAGYGVYHAMGFRTAEIWRSWVAVP
jgi:hypothetical protein